MIKSKLFTINILHCLKILTVNCCLLNITFSS